MAPGLMTPGLLVVGTGQAAVQLAVSMRENGYSDRISLIGDDPFQPYHRPPLSKGLLTGSSTAQSIALRSDAFYADREIDVYPGQRVHTVERTTTGGMAITSTGKEVGFTHLALATGARVRRLTVPGADLEGVQYLRDMADALALAARLADARDVVVVGGGFIGLEVASAATKAGARVTVVEAADRLMARAVHEAVSSHFLAAHRACGEQLLLETGVVEVTGSAGRVRSVVLTDGSEVPADLVVAGIGVEPRTELAESMGLACDGGILVDEFGRASDGVTVAVGDCASMPVPMDGGVGRCRIESVDNAVSHGRHAAGTLSGQLRPYRLIPYFWSDQGDQKLQMVGEHSGEGISDVRRGPDDADSFSMLFYRDELLVGAQCVNKPADFVAIRRLLARSQSISAAAVADASVPLRQMDVVERPVPAV